MLDLLFFLGGLGGTYLVVTLVESFLHEHIHHAGPVFRELQRRFPRCLRAFRTAFRAHAIVHHRLTFRDHVTQFADPEQKRKVDGYLAVAAGGALIAAEDYGTTLHFRSVIFFLCPIMPVVGLAFWLLPWSASLGILPVVTVYPLLSSVLHRYLHRPYAEALAMAPPLWRPVLRSAYVRCLWRHHWLHHRHPRCNFNLMLGGDWLRGVHRQATGEEIVAMRNTGLPVD